MITYSQKLKSSLEKSKNIVYANVLKTLMSKISEDHFCAGWLVDLEYKLWSMVIDRSAENRDFGFGEVLLEQVDVLSELNLKSGGWWYWAESDTKQGYNGGELFVTTEEWLEMYRNR